jgi:hypothetical protein
VTTEKPTPKPPKHPSRASAAWWRALVAEYAFLPHQLRTLTAAAESWDRKEEARARVAAEGSRSRATPLASRSRTRPWRSSVTPGSRSCERCGRWPWRMTPRRPTPDRHGFVAGTREARSARPPRYPP